MTGVEVRPMRPQDISAVHAIESAQYVRPWSRAAFASELAHGDGRVYLVATVSDEVVGYTGVMLAAGEAHVATLVVRPDQRRQGLGGRLLHAALSAARSLGATAATLEVRAGNRDGQRLYRRFGFAPVGIRPGYYEDTGEDALIMWLHDLQERVPEAAACS